MNNHRANIRNLPPQPLLIQMVIPKKASLCSLIEKVELAGNEELSLHSKRLSRKGT